MLYLKGSKKYLKSILLKLKALYYVFRTIRVIWEKPHIFSCAVVTSSQSMLTWDRARYYHRSVDRSDARVCGKAFVRPAIASPVGAAHKLLTQRKRKCGIITLRRSKGRVFPLRYICPKYISRETITLKLFRVHDSSPLRAWFTSSQYNSVYLLLKIDYHPWKRLRYLS